MFLSFWRTSDKYGRVRMGKKKITNLWDRRLDQGRWREFNHQCFFAACQDWNTFIFHFAETLRFYGVSGRSSAYSILVDPPIICDFYGQLEPFFIILPNFCRSRLQGQPKPGRITPTTSGYWRKNYSHINLLTSQIPVYAPGATYLIHVPRKSLNQGLSSETGP